VSVELVELEGPEGCLGNNGMSFFPTEKVDPTGKEDILLSNALLVEEKGIKSSKFERSS
jgi:hypothetical protein